MRFQVLIKVIAIENGLSANIDECHCRFAAIQQSFINKTYSRRIVWQGIDDVVTFSKELCDIFPMIDLGETFLLARVLGIRNNFHTET